jgi:hypothetical protein
MEADKWTREALELFEIGEDRDIFEGLDYAIGWGCSSPFSGTKLSVYEGNLVFTFVAEDDFPMKLVQVLWVELSLENRRDFFLGYSRV